jgi:serine/threonine-protein kinase
VPLVGKNTVVAQNISHYRILKKLGAGGMGVVYLAEDTQLERKVAIKLLPAESVADAQAKRRLVREAQAAAKLDHPNICSIYEVGEEGGHSFIVMQYVEGETLSSRIQRKSMDIPEALEIAEQVADALAAAHSRGIIHRDIKPQNIMLTGRHQAKVMDFGLAKVVRDRSMAGSEAATESLLTEPGAIVGTVQYMSPEQASGRAHAIDHRSDIFSFGCVLYEVVTGHKAFEGNDAIESLNKVIRESVIPIIDLNPTAPSDLQRIVRRCLAKDPDERYQTIKDVAIELKEVRRELQSIDTTVARRRTTTKLIMAVLLLALVVVAVVTVTYYLRARKTEVAIDSIAVLPFTNQNNDANNDWMADGLTENIMNSLTQLPNLKVIPRSSVFRYKGKETDPLKSGAELGARTVLTGRLMQRGDDLIVSAELTDVQNNKQIWGDHYQRKLSDLLGVQTDIARAISANLRLTLSGVDADKMKKRYTENAEAYQLYLKGRYFWLKSHPEALKKAATYFNQAIAADPNFALAYTGLADTYGASSTNGFISPREGYPKAKIAAKRALELDDSLAEAHTTAGATTMFYDFDWLTAEHEYKRSGDLNPNYEINYEAYAWLLLATGMLDDGIRVAQRGTEAAPLSVPLSVDVALAYYIARRYNKALEQAQKSLEIEPAYYVTWLILAEIYIAMGMHEAAIQQCQKAIDLAGRTSSALALLGHSYAMSGRPREASKILDELNRMSKREYVSPYDVAIVYVGLRDKDRAMEQLKKAYDDRAGFIIFLNVEPIFDPIRSDPAFEELVRRLKLG